MTKQGFFRLGYGRVFILALTFLLFSNYPFAAAQGTSESPRFRVFPLKHISVEQGKKHLAEAEIGTVSHLAGTAALLVTGQADELIKAKAILGLVDSQELFIVTAILPASTARNMPSNKQIAAQVGNISVGNFSNPPDDYAASKAIIDIHGDSLVVVAPSSRFREILFAIEQLEKKGTQARQVKKQPDEMDIRARPPFLSPTEDKGAVTAYEPGPIINGEQTLKLDLPEKFDITLLLGLVGPYLNLDFMYDPAKVSGEVTLMLQGKLQGPIKVKDLYPMLESVLKFKGFVMTRHKGNLVTVVPKEEALEIDPVLVDADKDEIEYGDIIVTRVFQLEHIDTTSAKNLLEAMKLTVDVTPIAETKTLIVTAFAYRMSRIETLLDVVDKPGEPKKFKFRQLQYTMAKTLAPKIQTLAEQLGTISIAIAAQPVTPPTTSPKRAGETDAAYRTRLLREAEARRRAALAKQAAKPATPAEKAKPTVYLDADERTNRILMIGLEEQLTSVEELIDTLDVEQQDLRTMRLYRIEHADAEEVKKKLEELEIISPSPTIAPYSRISTPPTAQKPVPTKAQMLLTGTTEEALVEEPQVVVVQATNSLLVSATDEQHIRIAEVLGYVDSEPETINYKVYPLENQDPNHLAGVTTTTEKRLEEEIIIIPEPKTYSLIVYASKENQQWISLLVQQLDEYRPQVLLDVTLVEVTKNDEFTLDLDMVSKFPKFAAGATMDYFTARIDPFPLGRIAEAVSVSGSGSGFYADEHIQVLLNAMHQKGYGRILARPKLLVNDNEEGTIEAKETQTIVSPTTEVIPGTAATAPTAVTSVVLAEYEAGITLTITPHIIITGREGDIKGPTPPDLLTSDVTTTVTVPDRSTIILGGLEKLTQSKGGTKVPVLGDIPLVGGLFRSTANSDIQSRLYVFVKAHILRPGEKATGESDIEAVSAHNRATFEKYEAEMQTYENWPGKKPKPMDPVRILETNNVNWRIANKKD
ncbi:MAG: type II secretion system protein D [Planctomycetota bacterium]|jgi:type II secretory pathway component GspD/PulD (secretin)